MKEREHKKVVAAITHGDVNGIGYEVILKALAEPRILDFCIPVIYGNSKAASYHRKTITASDYQLTLTRDLTQLKAGKTYIVNIVNDEIKIEFGKSDKMAGQLAHKALEDAITDINAGLADILVTAPINKKNIQSNTYTFPGHTEFLAAKYKSEDYMMLMVGPTLRIGVATGHIPISQVSTVLTKELIGKKIKILHRSLKTDFGISSPKIAVLGLNPHAGDESLLGTEERDIIEPAIRKSFENHINVFGPFPADSFFGTSAYREFDAILAMYHDQGLIPFKIMAFEDGVNFTAGLPIVRTSPAHGTGFDIAGKNMASCNSFRNALLLGVEIFQNRQKLESEKK
jgi:4-hydroxythreonine-4-phosphate dehydrogenase